MISLFVRITILVPDGVCPTKEIIERFILESTEIESRLRSFVVDKLRAYYNKHGEL
jgi:hypothetical protein